MSIEYYERMLDLIRALPVNLEIRCSGTDYLLVHGGLLGCRHRYDDPVRDPVWMRLDETTVLPEGKTLIFRHTPTCHYQSDIPMRIYYGNSRNGIDCGCAYPEGRLACMRLDDRRKFYSEPEKAEEEVNA